MSLNVGELFGVKNAGKQAITERRVDTRGVVSHPLLRLLSWLCHCLFRRVFAMIIIMIAIFFDSKQNLIKQAGSSVA